MCTLGMLKDAFQNNAALLRDHSKNKKTGTEWAVGNKVSITYLISLHALWYIRVWSIRVSTRFLKKIRVYKCPFSGNFKGIFLCEYSDYELVKGGYKGTHQYSFKGSHKGKLLLIWLVVKP